MHARQLVALTIVAALAAPAAAAASPVMISATGTAQVRVVPTNRHSNASIAAAELAAQNAGVPLALRAAQQQAGLYAAAAGLTLGPLQAISDASTAGPFYAVASVPGPFGSGRFCGVISIPIGNPKPIVKLLGHQKVLLAPRHVRFRKVHRCFVPSPATTTLVATYSAS